MSEAKQPIAIVGMQGRFPGDASTPGEFWTQLLGAGCFCAEVPASRWSNRRFATEDLAAGKTPVSRGYFLDYPFETFDPDVFGFVPGEIAAMDPQQRMLLEVAWEALEIAGIDPRGLAGQDAGVYVGGFTTDYLLNQFSAQARSALGRYSASGATMTMLSNRLSYALDLRGPSVTVDTACASSLSALSIAVRELRAGICPVALVGGVSFMLRPEYSIGMAAAGLLAIDGRSKPFSALADGYGRGEGCGVLILKSLAQAERDGDRVLALIAASGTGHAGRTAGISLPNGAAQRDVMRRVLNEAGLVPRDIGYVEAHGTGTAQGDPIEAQSIGSIYGADRSSAVPIGSLKANIGHMEAAAGVAGVIKAVLMLQKRQVPPHLMVGRPNPAILFDALNIRLPTAPEPLQGNHIAVNAFGYGGSTAHVIVSRAPEPSLSGPAPPMQIGPLLLRLSAQSAGALSAWMPRLAEYIEDGVNVADAAYTLAHRRHHAAYRAAVWVNPSDSPKGQAAVTRDALEVQRTPRGLVKRDRPPRTLFVFAGMGPQWASMGRDLWHASPVFRRTLAEVDQALQSHAGISVLEAIIDASADGQMDRCRVAQPANFAMQVALVRMLADHGLHPDLCLGHSAGEVAAAWASGHLTLAQAVTVCWARSELQDTCSGFGGLLASDMDAERAAEFCAEWPGLEVAAINGPSAVTLAGPDDTLDAALAAMRANGHAALRLAGDIPYHSAAMDAILAPLRTRLETLRPYPPKLPLLSSVTARHVDGPGMDAAYWCRNVRAPVQFQQALLHAFEAEVTHCVEVSPKSVLRKAILSTAKSGFHGTHAVALDEAPNASDAIRQAVARHYVSGGALDWGCLTSSGRLADLPPTGWQRQRFWQEAPVQAEDRLAKAQGSIMAEPCGMPHAWLADLNTQALAFLGQHRVDGMSVLPGAASIEAAIQTARATGEDGVVLLRDIRLLAPFALDRMRGQVLDSRRVGDSIETLAYDPADPANTQRVLSASVGGEGSAQAAADLATWAADAPYLLDTERFRTRLAALGFDHGEAFQCVTHLSMAADGTRALVQASVPVDLWQDAAFVLHPCLLDGLFQAGLALTAGAESLVPVGIGACTVFEALPSRIWACITLTEERSGAAVTFDAAIHADDGRALARLQGIEVMSLRPQTAPEPLPELCLATEWRATDGPALPMPARSVSIVGEGSEAALALQRALEAQGCEGVTSEQAHATVLLAFSSRGDLDDLLAQILDRAISLDHARLYVVTDHAHVAALKAGVVDPEQTALWGLARALYNEIDASGTTLIDISRDEDWPAQVAREIAMNSASSEVMWRGGQRLLPRLIPASISGKSAEFRSNGSYLITGGLGGMGRGLAIWAAHQGAGHLVLSTRVLPGKAEILPMKRTLAALGAELEVIELDLSDAAAVRATVQRIDGSDHSLTGIFHWAGQTADRMARDMSAQDIQAVTAPKITGAKHLHLASLDCRLEHFVMASSLSALVGNQRQANYAAANAYLDGLAWARRAAGLPALSVNFGAISGAGMAANPRVAAHLLAAGLPAMTPATALAGLGAAMRQGLTQISLAQGINVARWARYDPRCAATDKMAGIVGDTCLVTPGQSDLSDRLVATAPDGRAPLITDHLIGLLAATMECPPERLVPDRAMGHQGLDSLAAVEFQIAIEQDLGVAIPIMSLIGGQSPVEVAAQISKELADAQK